MRVSLSACLSSTNEASQCVLPMQLSSRKAPLESTKVTHTESNPLHMTVVSPRCTGQSMYT